MIQTNKNQNDKHDSDQQATNKNQKKRTIRTKGTIMIQTNKNQNNKHDSDQQ